MAKLKRLLFGAGESIREEGSAGEVAGGGGGGVGGGAGAGAGAGGGEGGVATQLSPTGVNISSGQVKESGAPSLMAGEATNAASHGVNPISAIGSSSVNIFNTSSVKDVLTALRAHPSNADAQERACRALGELVEKDDTLKLEAVEGGGIETVIAAMRTHPSNAVVQHCGCGFL